MGWCVSRGGRREGGAFLRLPARVATAPVVPAAPHHPPPLTPCSWPVPPAPSPYCTTVPGYAFTS